MENVKEYIIFILLCLLAVSAGAYLTYRANRFDTFYEIDEAREQQIQNQTP